MAEAMENALHPTSQSLSLADALAIYTANAAFACGLERRCGAIAEGYLADFVILDVQGGRWWSNRMATLERFDELMLFDSIHRV